MWTKPVEVWLVPARLSGGPVGSPGEARAGRTRQPPMAGPAGPPHRRQANASAAAQGPAPSWFLSH